jgi:Fe-S-cluster-containing dehydrogenase component/DMSO reductase anchor subunit
VRAAEHGRTVRLPVIGNVSLLERLLEEQQEFSAVERFAQRHADADRPLLEPTYRARLPATPPGPGQQYAFEVDLDRCSGCKACVTACHSLNGLDAGETWRGVGVLHGGGGGAGAPVLKTVTAACHHCVDPACMRGCPARAYEKDPVTGIVRHLDDACIGCQYCTFTCPYEVPQYNAALGIVRKCDMCAGRLAAGEAPACVQACPNEAIRIGVVDVARVVEDAQTDAFLPGAPPPSITVPTTVYTTAEALPRNLVPADFWSLGPAHQHWPLVVMLVLTQLGAGTLLGARALAWLGALAQPAALAAPVAVASLAVALLALAASTLHLGRPLLAWRALLGLRRSWISREILVFGLFVGAASLHAAAVAPLPAPLAPLAAPLRPLAPALGDAAALLGLAGVICSVMLYAVTHRAWWSGPRTALRFLGTTALGGAALLHLVAVVTGARALADGLALAVGIFAAAKLGGELGVLAHLRDHRHGELKRSALLLVTQLRRPLGLRVALALGGGVVAPLAAYHTAGPARVVWAAIALAALLAGELLERRFFFAAASAPRMPGVFR